jgi:DNA ligase-1
MDAITRFETLYKRGSKGEIRAWAMELGTDAMHSACGHRVVSGILNGTMTESGWNITYGKNLSKKNATDSHSQAVSEIENNYTIKRSRGYFDDPADVDKVEFTKPMLAQDYDKRKAKIDVTKGVYSQPKLDGIRCVARADGLWTRTGKPITSMPHIIKALAPLFKVDADLELDGELYNHALKDDFNTITSIVRKENPDAAEMAKARELVQYHVYDIPSHGGLFLERLDTFEVLLEDLADPVIQCVPTVYVRTQEGLDELNAEYVFEGYEGQMVRLDAVYENKRSNNLMKRKDFITEEFPVKAMEEGNGNWAGCVKRFVVLLPNGNTCEATPRGTQVALRALLESGKVPDWATVRYFGYTPDGKLRFPIATDYGYGVRSD